jgi:hypothetical protein
LIISTGFSGCGGGVATVTTTDCVPFPPAPEHSTEYVVLLVGVTVSVPFTVVLFVHDAVHRVAFVDDHDNEVDSPEVIVVLEASNDIAGAGGACSTGGSVTVTVTVWVPVPPSPEQVTVYVCVSVGVIVSPPCMDVVGHGVVHDVAFIADQLRVVDCPFISVVLAASKVTCGGGVTFISGAGPTAILIESRAVPPAPVHVTLNEVLSVRSGVVNEDCVATGPTCHDELHDEAPEELQESTVVEL